MPEHQPNAKFGGVTATLVTLSLAIVLALALTQLLATAVPRLSDQLTAVLTSGAAPIETHSITTSSVRVAQTNTARRWAASAPGRVQPKGGEVAIRAETRGPIAEIYVRAHDQLRKGDLIARLKDHEARTRLLAAKAEVAVRLGERDEGKEKNKLVKERRAAADELAAAERALHDAWHAFDKLFAGKRGGEVDGAKLNAARGVIERARDDVSKKRDNLRTIASQSGMPQPTRLDSGLALARADVRLAEIALERTRIRAPVDGMVLRTDLRVGEMTSPSQVRPLAVVGQTGTLEVIAEVQERDATKVHVGQDVVLRSNAFEKQEFAGRVTKIAPSVGSPGLRAQGPNKNLDVEVLEVTIELAGEQSLLPGMRVDVFFKMIRQGSAATRRETN